MESSADSPRRSSSDSSSEFEFWMVGKEPSIPQAHLLTADELFVNGVLLPLHLLPRSHPNPNSTTQLPSEPEPETPPPPPDSSTSPPPTSFSKRWIDILKAGERNLAQKVRKKERRDSAGNAAELLINIWPFSRSRSTGNAGTGTGNTAKVMVARRKAGSTPCSRSNSRGESSNCRLPPPPPPPGGGGRPTRDGSGSMVASTLAGPARSGILGGTASLLNLRRRPTEEMAAMRRKEVAVVELECWI